MKFKEAIEVIKDRLNIVDVVSEYVNLKRRGNNYIGLCPFHNEDTPSFTVSESRQFCKCFGCGKGGNIYTFLQEYLEISFREAVLMLAKKANIEIEDDYQSNNYYKEIEEKKKKLYDLHRDVANEYYKTLYSDKGKEGLEYLRSRKLSDATIKKFGLGFAPNDFGYMYKLMKNKGYDDTLLFESKLFRLYNDKPCDMFFNRVIFPLVDIYKHVIGFQSRTLDPDAKMQKYVNSLDSIIFHKNSFIYAMNYAYLSNEKYYILCEGNMDAITLHQSGFDSAIATQGTAFNEKHVYLLKRKPKKVYLCQDSDDAGVNAIISSNKILQRAGIETYVLDIKPAKDVDEFINKFGIEEFRKRINKPIPTLLFYVSSLKRKYNINDPYEQEKYLNDIVLAIKEIDNEIIRDRYISDIAIQEKLDRIVLKSLVNKSLKGNTVLSNNTVTVSKNENKDEFKVKENLSNVDSFFIYLIFLVPDYKEKIKEIIQADDLYNDAYKYIYNLYLDGKEISDIFSLIEDKEKDEKDLISKILLESFAIDENNTDKVLESLNMLIKQIKIRRAKNLCGDSIENKFELNQQILEINNKKYL